MKLPVLASILFILLLSQGCNFEVNTGSEKNEPIPNSSCISKGLKSDAATMTVDGEASTSNIFTFGNKVKFDFNNVTGFKRINGLVFPGLTMHITDDKDSTIYFVEDLLEEFDIGTDLSPLLLDANFNVNLPHRNNEKYNVRIKIWDKKGSGTLTFDLPFEVKASELLSIESKGLNYSNIYFWDETDQKVVLENNITSANTYIIINEGLEGFDVVDGKAYPGISLYMVDNVGKQIISNDNLLAADSENGIDPIDLRDNQAPVTITFVKGNVANPCRLTTKIFDLKNPDKHITIEGDLILR